MNKKYIPPSLNSLKEETKVVCALKYLQRIRTPEPVLPTLGGWVVFTSFFLLIRKPPFSTGGTLVLFPPEARDPVARAGPSEHRGPATHRWRAATESHSGWIENTALAFTYLNLRLGAGRVAAARMESLYRQAHRRASRLALPSPAPLPDFSNEIKIFLPWLVWLSGLSTSL